MAANKKLQVKILSAAASAAVAILGQRLLKGSWRRVTGEEPPDPADPQVPVVKAISWLILSTLLLSVVQLLIQRKTARRTDPVTQDQTQQGNGPFTA
ncbi:MAG: DUF4235 domain-containing protein [Propionibacterium sp.]